MAKEVKQVIVMIKSFPREDGGTLSPRKGKVGAQCGHAVIAFFLSRMKFIGKRKYEITLTEEEDIWKDAAQPKIVLGCDSEHELMELFNKAKVAGLEVHIIKDSGRTEFKEPTVTCFGLGPNYADQIDAITGHLKLL